MRQLDGRAVVPGGDVGFRFLDALLQEVRVGLHHQPIGGNYQLYLLANVNGIRAAPVLALLREHSRAVELLAQPDEAGEPNHEAPALEQALDIVAIKRLGLQHLPGSQCSACCCRFLQLL